MEQSYNKKLLQQAVTDGREAKELYENRITKDFIEQLKRFHYESFLRHDIDSDAEGKRLMFIRMRAEVFEEFEKYLMITITEGEQAAIELQKINKPEESQEDIQENM